MAMDTLFGKRTPWNRAVTSCDELATLFTQGKDQICVASEMRAEWLLGHKVVSVEGKKRVLEFEDIGGGLWVARLFVPVAAQATTQAIAAAAAQAAATAMA